MDVKTLCLGVLSRGDATGYEIRKAFEEGPLSHFHEAGYGSIYPSLKKLSEQGLIRTAGLQDGDRLDKKVYSVTAKGRQALYDALLQEPDRDKIRSDFSFIVFFGHLLPPRHLDRVIEQRIAWCREQLREMDECGAKELDPGERFVMGLGRAVYTAIAEYLEAHRHELIGAAFVETKVAE